jgi:hypothetical protein
MGIASPAGATPAGYGFDGNAHIIVGGGSDTTYKVMIGISDLWQGAPGCDNTPPSPFPSPANLNVCNNPPTQTLGNAQHDTITQAYPTGSGAGLAALNQNNGGAADNVCYSGGSDPANADPTPCTAGVGPTVDFARSSRVEKTSAGNCAGGNELTCDTFWGFAEDGIEYLTFNNHQGCFSGTAVATADLTKIWNGGYTMWNQVPGYSATCANGPIVPWGMNTQSGTYATFKAFIGTDPSANAVDRQLSGVAPFVGFPFENDIKPIVNDVIANGITANVASGYVACGPGLSTDPTSACNPDNWAWWGSFGVLNAFPYTSSYTPSPATTPPTVTGFAGPVNGTLPSSSNVLAGTYPIVRTLFHVTKKGDADCDKPAGTCYETHFVTDGSSNGTTTVTSPSANFEAGDIGAAITGGTIPAATTISAVSANHLQATLSNAVPAAATQTWTIGSNPGPALPVGFDMLVNGGATGRSGAVREFTRFLCRFGAGQQTLDPFSGKNYAGEITSALGVSGFTAVPKQFRSPGSTCKIDS